MTKLIYFLIFIIGLFSYRSFALINSCTNSLSTVDGKLLVGDLLFQPKRGFLFNGVSNGMTKERFNEIIDVVTHLYQPHFEKVGAKLTVNKRWDDTNEDISSSQWPNGNWRITMLGGFARHPLITEDGFIFALCHEIGHHIGGAPRKQNNTFWASSEGQADYFASLKCFRKIKEKEDNITFISKLKIDGTVTSQCESVYKTPQDIALCKRTSIAGYSVANFIASRTSKPIIGFSTPDLTHVKQSLEEAAEAQCRLDTYFHGALCDKPITENLSQDDPTIGSCSSKENYTIGLRPRCWYSSNSENSLYNQALYTLE